MTPDGHIPPGVIFISVVNGQPQKRPRGQTHSGYVVTAARIFHSLTALFFGCKLMMIEAVILHSLHFVIGSQDCLIAMIKVLDTVDYAVEFYKFFYRCSTSIGVVPELICDINISYAY